MGRSTRQETPGGAARKKYIRLQTAAEIHSVHEVTIRRWIEAGLLTGYWVGPHAIRVDLAEVHALARPIEVAAGGES
ncbi:MerR family transcriptional regulator [Nocardia bovistercoris]|uniref:DNA-binding protein n=1 Tax=Nocardia bovistercoris TaxID=2785916 RepID=A0A931I558_9NOCA|nr:DNA-binding protein [Nocardia bovistercoris]MBH0775064.1 DNA-binding protein [Nocardia bovistercoris]